MEGGNTSVLRGSGSGTGGLHRGIGRTLKPVRLDVLSTGASGDRFRTSEVSDMH